MANRTDDGSRMMYVGTIRSDSRPKARTQAVEDAGVIRRAKFERDGVSYDVFETRPKRTVDHFRFEVRKEGESKAYVVSYQDSAGDRGQCSCKGWIFHRTECKHIKMCRVEFLTAAPARRPVSVQKPKALPARPAQLSMPGLDEITEVEKAIEALREKFRVVDGEMKAKEAELAGIVREGKQLAARLEKIKSRAA